MLLSLLAMLGSASAATDEVVFSETLKELVEAPEPETNVVAEAGATSSYGNTFSTVIYSNIDAGYRWGWRGVSMDGKAELGRSVSDADGDGTISDAERDIGYQSTSEEFAMDLRYDRYLDVRNAVYGLGGWLRDPFSGYESRLHLQSGFSRLVMDDEVQSLLAEIGLDVARETYTEGVEPGSAWHYSARGSMAWSRMVGETVVLAESLETFVNIQDPRDIRLISEASITVTATDILSVKTTYLIGHDTVPVDGFRGTDQTIALTLVAVMNRSGGPPVPVDDLGFGDDPS